MKERRIETLWEALRKAHRAQAPAVAPDAAWRDGVMRAVRRRAAQGLPAAPGWVHPEWRDMERVFWRFAAAGSLAAALLVLYGLVSGETAGAAAISPEDPLGLVATLSMLF